MIYNYFSILVFVLFIYMSLWFLVSLIRRRNDVADVAWGLGFVLMVWSAYFYSSNNTSISFLINSLITAWGLRLAWHIYSRNKGKGEDFRYLKWREEWGKWFYLRSYFQVYLLQGFFLFLIISPALFINYYGVNDLNILVLIGLIIWVTGFSFEVIGDAQLRRFILNPENKGKLMQSGLWAYSRHPNYFGEVTQWWGIWLISLVVPNGIYTIVGPLTITFLILKVSGVPLLEKKMEENPGFASYKKRVSMFIPLPPRNI
jgi:steroid 5-alpha reductase family enzyme